MNVLLAFYYFLSAKSVSIYELANEREVFQSAFLSHRSTSSVHILCECNIFVCFDVVRLGIGRLVRLLSLLFSLRLAVDWFSIHTQSTGCGMEKIVVVVDGYEAFAKALFMCSMFIVSAGSAFVTRTQPPPHHHQQFLTNFNENHCEFASHTNLDCWKCVEASVSM